MPPKEFEKGKLFFLNGDEIVEINSGSIEIEPIDASKINCCGILDGSWDNRPMEFEFDIKVSERMTYDDMILALCGFDAEKLKQNNWRKMHGMVMHKRRKK